MTQSMSENGTKEKGDTIYEPSSRIAVLLPLPLAGPYDYKVPEGLSVARGDVVAVPLGTRTATGVVWGDALGDVDDAKLRSRS